MALVGTIKDFGLADILQLIGLQRKTGVLTLERGTETVSIKFLEGAVVGAETSLRNLEDLLGSVLVRTGRITQAQLREARYLQKTSLQRLGYVLVKQNFISSADMEEALRIQVTQILYRLFRWREGKYQFAPMDHIEYDTEHFRPMSAETILMEGARMIDEWPILERRIKSPEWVFRKTTSGAALDVPIASLLDADIDFGFQDQPGAGDGKADATRLSPQERDVLRLVDGTARVQDILDTSALAEFDVYRMLVDLLNRDLIDRVEATVVEQTVAPRRIDHRRWASAILQVLVLALAAVGIVTIGANPFTPWDLAGRSRETRLLKSYISRNRLERVGQALQAYYLDRGSMPGTLEALAAAGYLPVDDTIDPWGRRYGYQVGPAAYELRQRVPAGDGESELVIRHPFSASQRMVLEGGAAGRDRPASP